MLRNRRSAAASFKGVRGSGTGGENLGEREGWALRIEEASTRERLRALDAQLAAVDAPWARAERLKIGLRLAKLKAKDGIEATIVSKPAFAQAYGLPAPDGRWLYSYRLGATAFIKLEADLKRLTPVELAHGYAPGLFVLWASEWFRRRYEGNGHRWRDLADALSIPEDQGLFRQLTGEGLRLWRRPLRQSGGTAYLGSLAREGGFPAAAVRDGGSGWASVALAAIIAPLLTEPESDAQEARARALAAAQINRLPQLFRDEDFFDLCADLACAIVALRREADEPAAAARIPTAAWLSINIPDWQARLPLNTSDRAAAAMLERLLHVAPLQGGGVSVTRFLERIGDHWVESAALTLDGTLDTIACDRVDQAYGRLRVFGAGELARHLPGELAMLEAPSEGERLWTARATRRARQRHAIPFATPIELDLRAGDQRVDRITLAGGKPRRGALIVTAIEAGSPEAPTLLRVVGSGSGQYRAETLVVQAPADWMVLAVGDEIATEIGMGVAGVAGYTRLWRVTRGAFFTDPLGDRFRILCGQPADQPNRIELIGQHASWAETGGDIDLYVGSPLARIGAGGGLFVRAIGSGTWVPAPQPLPIGHYDLGWRRDKILLDRRRIAILPATSQLRRSGPPNHCRYELSGFGDCALVPDEGAPVHVVDPVIWRHRPGSSAIHWFAARLRWPDAPELIVRIEHPTAAAVARWTGRHLPNQAQFTLADLPELVAVSETPVKLMAELTERGRVVAEMVWAFEGELPMSSIGSDLKSLLLPASIDAEVRLSMLDGLGSMWRVRQFPHDLKIDCDTAYVPRGLVTEGAVIAGRALADASREHVFGTYSLLTDSNHRPAALPPLGGNWLVYVLDGEQVLTRPRFVAGSEPVMPTGRLGDVMRLPQGPVLNAALDELLATAARDDAEGAAVIDELLALVTSLGGLPPATFHILELLAKAPAVLVRMAFQADAEQRGAVMALSDALPFAWATIPLACWQEAQGAAFARAIGQLSMLGAEAPHFAKQVVDQAVACLIDREPLLAAVLTSGSAHDLAMIAQAFLNRAVDRVPPAAGDRYRRQLGVLPRYFLKFDPRFLDTLDAPCAAAAAVAGLWTPGAADIRHIKTVARSFPTYFADAYAASLQEYS